MQLIPTFVVLGATSRDDIKFWQPSYIFMIQEVMINGMNCEQNRVLLIKLLSKYMLGF